MPVNSSAIEDREASIYRLPYQALHDTIFRNIEDMESFGLPPSDLPNVDIGYLVNDIENYRRMTLDLHRGALAGLDQVWTAAYQVDTSTAYDLLDNKNQYDSLIKEFKALYDLICPIEGGHIKLFTISTNDLKDYLFKNTTDNEKAYDLALQAKVLALLDDPRFSQAIWDRLDDAGKQALLNELLAEVAAIMNLGQIVDVSGNWPPLSLSLANLNSPNAYYSYYSIATNQITIFPSLMATNDLDLIMRAIFHETRHVYQFESAIDYYVTVQVQSGYLGEHQITNDQKIVLAVDTNSYTIAHPYVSNRTVMNWSNNFNDFIDIAPGTSSQALAEAFCNYVSQPLEFDAWSFSGMLEPEVFKKLESNEDNLYKLNPSYPGSWNVPQKP
ncbi:MAG: hypothetical protein FWD72_00680 [Eggerthellaceae bacterium]|nr:hypothetical protein [Eggerthellaceae bacterium]